MNLIKNINYILEKKERKYLWIIFFGIIISTILETISIASIIPVFNIIFLEKFSYDFFPELENIKLTNNLKILVLLIFVIVFFIKNIYIIAFNFFFLNFIYNLNTSIANRLFYHCLRQDYIFFIKGGSKNFLQKVTDNVNNANSFLISLVNFSIEVIFIIVISFFLLFVNYKIFLFCFLIFFFIVFFYYNIFKKKINNWSISYLESSSKIKSLVISGIDGIKDLIIYKLQNSFSTLFNIHSKLANKTKSKMDFLNNVQKYWLEMVAIFAMSLASVYFIFTNFDINELLPVFSVFVFVLFRMLSSFSRIILHGQNIKFHFNSFISVVQQFQSFDISSKSLCDKKFKFEYSLEFKSVDYFYNDISNKVLRNVNLKIEKGNVVGIIGKNAAGKTTFLNLVSGLIEPSKGDILIDAKYNLYKNRPIWMEKLSYVQQGIFLLDTTIKNNICLVDKKDKIDEKKFVKILNYLELELFFKNMPHLLNTEVGNNGFNLSGGQKQMISLARALYKESEVIILDEPSSALDASNIKLLKKIILLLKGHKTIFIVTHDKNSFIECFDKLIEINSGNVYLIE